MISQSDQFVFDFSTLNGPRSIYHHSNMAPRLSGKTAIFGVVFFVSRSLLGNERQKKLKKFTILTRKPRTEPCENTDISDAAH